MNRPYIWTRELSRRQFRRLHQIQQARKRFDEDCERLSQFVRCQIWTPLLTSILAVWCVKSSPAILKYVKYSAVLENDFPASQLRREVNRGVHLF